MAWRDRAKRIIRACFDWHATDFQFGLVRVTARGATAGFGATEAVALTKAVDATLRDIEAVACTRGMTSAQRLDAVRRTAILDVHRHAG